MGFDGYHCVVKTEDCTFKINKNRGFIYQQKAIIKASYTVIR